jgi:uncharacterized protein YdaU (DUF1376 family)
MNYFRFWIGDYLKDTAQLSLTEHGSYLLLMAEYYNRGGALDADISKLHRLCRAFTQAEAEAVTAVAERFFPVNGDGLRHNKRADEELSIALPAIEEMRQAGRKGAAARWGKNGVGHRVGYGVGQENPNGPPNGVFMQPPTSNLQPPAVNRQPSTVSLQPSPKAKKPSASLRSAGRKDSEGRTVETWKAYSEAYKQRYGVEPLRNGKVNGMLGKFLERVPGGEAPAIAAFYVTHNRALYGTSRHCIDLLLRDAEGLRTEWASGKTMTETEARQADRTQATANAFSPLIAEAVQREQELIP